MASELGGGSGDFCTVLYRGIYDGELLLWKHSTWYLK
jgi:hypothetical protein